MWAEWGDDGALLVDCGAGGGCEGYMAFCTGSGPYEQGVCYWIGIDIHRFGAVADDDVEGGGHAFTEGVCAGYDGSHVAVAHRCHYQAVFAGDDIGYFV